MERNAKVFVEWVEIKGIVESGWFKSSRFSVKKQKPSYLEVMGHLF